MAERLEIIGEQRIDYEVPYITLTDDKIESTTVQINERREGIYINYALMCPSDQKLEKVFPGEGIDHLAKMIRKIFQTLDMNRQKIILQLWEDSPINGLYSVEGRAPVNKQRDTVMIILTKTPFVYKYGYELVLWHQAMHAKDRIEHRFPCAHPFVNIGPWLDVLWHFSVDGRLQKIGRPHYSKSERLDEASKLLQGLCRFDNTSERVAAICDELWGREVTFPQLIEIGRDMGLALPNREEMSSLKS